MTTSHVTYQTKTWFDGPSRADEALPRGRIVEMSARFILPASATREQIMEWVSFHLGWGSIETDGSLTDHEIDLIDEPTLTDTGRTTDRLDVREAAYQRAVGSIIHDGDA